MAYMNPIEEYCKLKQAREAGRVSAGEVAALLGLRYMAQLEVDYQAREYADKQADDISRELLARG